MRPLEVCSVGGGGCCQGAGRSRVLLWPLGGDASCSYTVASDSGVYYHQDKLAVPFVLAFAFATEAY